MAKKKRKKSSRVWTVEERKAFGERMRAGRSAKGTGEFKTATPEKIEIPEEVAELSGIPETEYVDINIKNEVRINGQSYKGMCRHVPKDRARDLQYRSDMADWAKKKELDSTDHTQGRF